MYIIIILKLIKLEKKIGEMNPKKTISLEKKPKIVQKEP